MKQLTQREPTPKAGSKKASATPPSLPGCGRSGVKAPGGKGLAIGHTRAIDGSPTRFPDTIAGRMAKDFIEAFNTGDAEAMGQFERKHRAESALATRTMKERLEQYRGLHEDWGKLDVHKITERSDRDISVAVVPGNGSMDLEFTFELAEAPSEKLVGIRIVPTILDTEQRSDATPRPSDSNSSVEVVSLAESIEPLRQRFNTNKEKHRFIAILSPT